MAGLLTLLGVQFANAQTTSDQPTTPEQQAAQYMVNQLTNEKMTLLIQVVTSRGQVIELSKKLADSARQIEDLTHQLTEAKKLAAADKQSP